MWIEFFWYLCKFYKTFYSSKSSFCQKTKVANLSLAISWLRYLKQKSLYFSVQRFWFIMQICFIFLEIIWKMKFVVVSVQPIHINCPCSFKRQHLWFMSLWGCLLIMCDISTWRYKKLATILLYNLFETDSVEYKLISSTLITELMKHFGKLNIKCLI